MAPSLVIAVQPVVDLRTGLVTGYEALARFPELGRTPDVVFAEAHRAGHGCALEARAIEAALAVPGRPDGAFLTVNVSPTALGSPEVAAVLDRDLAGVIVEVTENEAAGGQDLAATLDRLRERGARIAVDDAGSGYAGLRQLMEVRPDLIKLDRTLVTGLHEDPAKTALVESFVRFAGRIGAEVCAEGIETLAELRCLADLDVVHGQGYALARPAAPWPAVAPEAAAACRGALRDALGAAAPDAGGLHDDDRSLTHLAALLAGVGSRADLEDVMDVMRRLLHADEVCYSVLDEDRRNLVCTLELRWADAGESWPIAEYPATRRVVEDQVVEQVIVGDPEADPQELRALHDLDPAIRGLLMVPVVAGGRSVGLLEVFTLTQRPWTRAEIMRARLFGYQLGAVLHVVELVRDIPAAVRRAAA